MWIRKTEQEKIAAVQPGRFSPGLPVVTGLFLGFLSGFCGLFTGPLSEALGLLLVGGIFGFAVVYVCQLIFGFRGAEGIISALFWNGCGGVQSYEYFCPKCLGVQLYHPKGCLQCGSQLEKADDWKWKSDQATSPPDSHEKP